MLSREDNERLVRVGKGTPLGELFRLYWIPFLPSWTSSKTDNPSASGCSGKTWSPSGIPRAASAWSIRPVRTVVLR